MQRSILMFCFLVSLECFANGASVAGRTTALQGSTETYVVEWSSWDNMYEQYANVYWDAPHGTIIASDKHSVTVQWNVSEDYSDVQTSVSVSEDLGSQSGGLAVELLNTRISNSEFCDGILGPPAIAVDFGSGGNPGPPLPGGATSYTYNSSCAVFSNQYTRTNSSVGCRGLWHEIPEDRTPGDSNGYFLMVDADDSRGEFYRTTVSGLNSAFRYEFSAWVGNLINTSGYQNPTIRFEVYGPSGLIKNSGDIDIPRTSPFEWRKVGFMFDVPVGVTVVDVVVVNRNRNRNGNDLVLDDISFAPCYPRIFASFQNGVVVDRSHTCDTGSVNLYSWWPSAIPFTSPGFQWQRSEDNGATWWSIPGAISVTAAYTENTPGIYQYRIMSYEQSSPDQFVVSNPLTYFVQRMVVPTKRHDLYSCKGGGVTGRLEPSFFLEYADPSVSQNFTFNWSPSTYLTNPNEASPSISLPSAGASPPPNGPPAPAVNYSYVLTVRNTNYGCVGSGAQAVAHYNPRKVYVPSGFTPNGDGLNDTFRPINIEDYPGSEFWVFNRWGQVVFNSKGPTSWDYSWDGTFQGIPQRTDVFPWRVEIRGCPYNVYSGTDGDEVPWGTTTLVR